MGFTRGQFFSDFVAACDLELDRVFSERRFRKLADQRGEIYCARRYRSGEVCAVVVAHDNIETNILGWLALLDEHQGDGTVEQWLEAPARTLLTSTHAGLGTEVTRHYLPRSATREEVGAAVAAVAVNFASVLRDMTAVQEALRDTISVRRTRFQKLIQGLAADTRLRRGHDSGNRDY